MKLLDTKKAELLKAANITSYYLKRSYDVKLEICENIIKAERLTSKVEAVELLNWFDENKPTKPKAAKAEKAKAEPVFTGQTEVEALPVLPNGVYLITTAQNNTPVHGEAFDSLRHIASRVGATLLVIPNKYQKLGEMLSADEVVYCNEVEPYLLESSVWLGKENGVKISLDNILITQKMPMNASADLNTGEPLTLCGHAKQQLKTLPRAAHDVHRWAGTTGICTQINYSNSRAGAVAASNHVYGGLLVAVYDDSVTIDNLVYSGGRIQAFLTCQGIGEVAVSGSKELDTAGLPSPNVVLGDIHSESMPQRELDSLLRFLDAVKPERAALHDLLDMRSQNGHARQSFAYQYQKQSSSISEDVWDVSNFLFAVSETVKGGLDIVRSNHDDMLDRWLDEKGLEPRMCDARLYHQLKLAQMDNIDNGVTNIALKEAFELVDGCEGTLEATNSNMLELGETKKYHGVVVSEHGHKGMNGARSGLVKSLVPMVHGHTHSPMLVSQSYGVVGISGSLHHGYNAGGLTTWDHANMIIHSNGALQLVPLFPIAI